jgi:ribosomal protein L32
MKITKYFVVRCTNCGTYRVYTTQHDFIKQGTSIKCFTCNKYIVPNKSTSAGYSTDVRESNHLEACSLCGRLNGKREY